MTLYRYYYSIEMSNLYKWIYRFLHLSSSYIQHDKIQHPRGGNSYCWGKRWNLRTLLNLTTCMSKILATFCFLNHAFDNLPLSSLSLLVNFYDLFAFDERLNFMHNHDHQSLSFACACFAFKTCGLFHKREGQLVTCTF